MHFILGHLAALAGIAFFIIRAINAARAARELSGAASEAKGFLRRRRWQAQTNTDHIRDIDDPRLAAAVMMCALAKSDDDLSANERDTILDQLKGKPGLSNTEAEEMLAQARWLTRDMKELGTVLHRASPPIKAYCNAQEMTQLLDMLTVVARADGPIDELQQDAIDRLHRELV